VLAAQQERAAGRAGRGDREGYEQYAPSPLSLDGADETRIKFVL
jgi:hypothetical protein